MPDLTVMDSVDRMAARPVTEVVLERGRGPVGGEKLTVGLQLWRRIAAVARPGYVLEEDRTVLPVVEAARFVTCLKVNEREKTAGWPEQDRETFRAVLSLLFRHDGLVISKR